MRQVWIEKNGGPEVLTLRDAPDPTPGPGEVRVQVEASGINFADLMARMGVYPDCPPLPCVVGYEVAGVIDAVGEGVSAERVGQPVVALTRFTGYSTAVTLPAAQAVVRPAGLDAVTAAAIPVQGLTAWMMCEVFGRVREGDRVLVHSAGGGVGLMCLDLLRWRGATAVGTASAGKHAFLKERGYHELVDYRSVDFYEALKDGPAFDRIFDPLGGASWGKGFDLLQPGGLLVCFGMSTIVSGNRRSLLSVVRAASQVQVLRFSPGTLMNNNLGVAGVNMGHLWDHADRVTGWLEALLQRWQEGVLRPVVHATVPFDQPHEAHRILHDRENLGKVVLTV